MNDAAHAHSPATLPNTRSRRVRADANGADYRINLWIPPGPPPPEGFPAIYVLDANALFGTFVEAVQRSSRRPDATGIEPAAVIGIAHDGDDLYETRLRRRDYTSVPPITSDTAAADDAGGADAFLSFITDQLAPSLRAEFPLDAARQVLFGHSLAGYFVLHALTARADAFRHYAAISPSVWWDETGLHERLQRLPDSPAHAFVAVGEWEGELPPWQRHGPDSDTVRQRRGERRMIEAAQAVAERLRERLGNDRVAFHLFPDEDHASVLMIAIQRMLRFALAPSEHAR